MISPSNPLLNTKNFIDYFLTEDGDRRFFKELLKRYNFSIKDDRNNSGQKILHHTSGSSFHLGGENMQCLLSWLFVTIEQEAISETTNRCQEKFTNNLLQLIK